MAVDYGSGEWGGYSPTAASTSLDGTITGADLWMFGDSIARRVQRDLAQQMLDQRDQIIAVDNCAGRRTTETVDVLAGWLQRFTPPAQILMASGANDVFDPTVMPAQIDRVMTLLDPTVQVWWRDVQVCRTAGSTVRQVADQRNTGWVNSTLYAAAARWPNLNIIAWARPLAAKPTRLTAYLEDGVHPNDAGVAFHNALILQALPLEAP